MVLLLLLGRKPPLLSIREHLQPLYARRLVTSWPDRDAIVKARERESSITPHGPVVTFKPLLRRSLHFERFRIYLFIFISFFVCSLELATSFSLRPPYIWWINGALGRASSICFNLMFSQGSSREVPRPTYRRKSRRSPVVVASVVGALR